MPPDGWRETARGTVASRELGSRGRLRATSGNTADTAWAVLPPARAPTPRLAALKSTVVPAHVDSTLASVEGRAFSTRRWTLYAVRHVVRLSRHGTRSLSSDADPRGAWLARV